MRHCDLFVIGGGSGGVRAARLAAARGLRVVLAEKSRLGGTCVNVGCVPKKLYYYAAGYRAEWRAAAAYGYGDAALGDVAWRDFLARKDREINRLNAVYEKLLQDAGAQIIAGEARLDGENRVCAGDEVYAAKHILLASGGAPARAQIAGGELAMVSDDMFTLSALPRRAVIVGGGYIALEFAGIFAGLGAQTTLCYRADLPMRALDDDIRQRLADGMAHNGICLRAGAAPQAIEKNGDALRVCFAGGDAAEADVVLFATGRRPASAGLGLENIGIAPRDNGTIKTNDSYRSDCPGVYAIGDLIQTPALTPVATAEAEAFVRRVFDGDETARVDYEAVPTAVFSRPSVAVCGIGEKAAAKRGLEVRVYAAAFKPMKSAFAGDAEESYVKLLAAADSGRVIGAQMLGDNAAEIMQGIAVAIKAGATKSDFDGTVGIHPTSAEEFVTLRDVRR